MAGGVLGIFILFGVSVARETTQKTLLIYRVIHLETYFSVSLIKTKSIVSSPCIYCSLVYNDVSLALTQWGPLGCGF